MPLLDKIYQVFVSSTYLDLVEERQAAIKAVVDLGHMPSGMEGFPAIDMGQLQYIKTVINQCDYYILIVGDRYGSLAPDGISFTEKEYRYAVKRRLKVIAFVKEQADSSTLEENMNPQQLKRYLAFREEVTKNRIIK